MKQVTKASIDRYAQDGVPTGDFLRAVLTNDLMGAVGHADEENARDLVEICQYIYNEIPSISHGSKKHVEQWIATGGLTGRDRTLEQIR